MLKKRIMVMFTVVALTLGILTTTALPAMADTNYNGQTDSEVYHQTNQCIPQPYYEDSCQRHNISEY